jgi:hypothetical protein
MPAPPRRARLLTLAFLLSSGPLTLADAPPADAWPARRAAALAGTADDRRAAAWWAVQKGLAPEAVELLKAGAARDAADPALARLSQVIAGLEAPLPDPDLAPLERLLPPAARTARGPHTLLIHGHDEAEAARKVALLERVLWTFYLEGSQRGLALRPPRERLVFLLFRDRAAYQARLKAEGATAFLDTHGYFHPTRLVVLQCDERAFEPTGPRGSRDRARAQRDVGTAAHEWAHLLARVSGLVPRHEDWPLWLHEGFAMQYEAATGDGTWAGPGEPSPERLADWRTLARPVPLERLLDPARPAVGYDRGFYAAAWAWVYFLRTEHPDAWAGLLHAGQNPDDAGLRRPAAVRSRLEAATGKPLASLQRDWHAFLRGLPTPGPD